MNNLKFNYCNDFFWQSERFVLCAKVCPSALLGYTPPPGGYMFVIGVIETLSAVLLLLPFPEFHKEVYMIFSVLMVLAIYTHGVLSQFDKMIVPTCLFLLSVVLYKAGHISPFANSILE